MTSMFFSEQVDIANDPAFTELLRLADNAEAANTSTATAAPIGTAIDRWHDLFNYDADTASRLIVAQRQNVMSEQRISDDHWDLIKHRWEPMGYDKEAYEHAQRLEDVLEASSTNVPGFDARTLQREDGGEVFVFRLGGLLDTREKVREVAGMDGYPMTTVTKGEGGMVELCVVGKEERRRIQDFLRSKRVGR